MQDFKTMRDMCAEQEEKFQFERFSRRDALNIGLKLIENAEKQAQPVAVEITVNGLVVFRYFMEGSIRSQSISRETVAKPRVGEKSPALFLCQPDPETLRPVLELDDIGADLRHAHQLTEPRLRQAVGIKDEPLDGFAVEQSGGE